MLTIDPNQTVIYALVFILGLLVGGFLFTGGGRKWKARYNAEVDRRKELETRHNEAERTWRDRERELARERPVVASTAVPVGAARDPRDVNNDGVVTPAEKPGLIDRVMGRDRDNDGVKDSRDGHVDRDGDGIDDRREV
jgi:hypothetical protein